MSLLLFIVKLENGEDKAGKRRLTSRALGRSEPNKGCLVEVTTSVTQRSGHLVLLFPRLSSVQVVLQLTALMLELRSAC